MYQETIFESRTSQPLAARLRPQNLDEYCGQKQTPVIQLKRLAIATKVKQEV